MTNHEYVCSMLIKLMMLVLLVLCHHADSGSIIKFLPGFEGPLPFELETGYIGVGEKEEVQLFYYFIKSERNPKEDPLFLWLTGGPGCSSANGLFIEIGPVTFKVEEDYDGNSIPTMVSTNHSWTKLANIIFLDQPVGTGFSYARTGRFDTPCDSVESKRIHQFLRKWLSKHTEFISNQFYVTGNSYSGKIIPVVVQEISKGNDLGLKPQINLQGYLIGNPATDYDFDENHRVQYAHGMGLISDELFQLLKSSCGGTYVNVNPLNTECLQHVEEYQKCTARINLYHILEPFCKTGSYDSNPRRYIEELPVANLSVPSTDDCYTYTDAILARWNNDESVRKVLGVVKGTTKDWVRCKMEAPYNKNIKSSIPYHKNNSIKGYRSLIFSGDHDFIRPFLSVQEWTRSLNYSIVDKWRPWLINNQVAGYTQSYANKMTFATVKGGGHTIDFRPAESFVLFQRWISGQLL